MSNKNRVSHSLSDEEEEVEEGSAHLGSILLFAVSSPPAESRQEFSERRGIFFFFFFLQIYLNPQRHNYLSCSTSPSAPPSPPLPLLSHFIDESIWPDCPGSSHANTCYQSSPSINSTHCPTVPTANLHLSQLELQHAANPTSTFSFYSKTKC